MATKYLDYTGLSYFWSKIKSFVKNENSAIPFGQVDSTSTSTVFTASINGITELRNGVCCYLRNGVVTSAENWTLNINSLGAKPVYSSLAAASRTTTIFNINYAMLFVYNETRIDGGCWDIFYGYDSNTNTIGYQVRTNSLSLPMTKKVYRYRLLFTSADGENFVPANNSSSTNATASRTVCQDKIDPFGRIVYYGYTTAIDVGSRPGTSYLWQQYNLTLGYSFNRTGAALTLTSWKPVYVKCAPQSDGSAIIDSTTPYTQALPSSEDGNIYIFLGIATAATTMELTLEHPIYYYKDGMIRPWTNAADSGGAVTSVNGQTGAVTIDIPVTSVNGQTGAVTVTAPVTSVNGQTGAVTVTSPVTSVNGQTGAVTVNVPVTDVDVDGTSVVSNGTAYISMSNYVPVYGGNPTEGKLYYINNGWNDEEPIYIGVINQGGASNNEPSILIGPSNVHINKLTNPVSDDDAATKKYVDDSIPDVPVTSVNGQTGAVTVTAPVTSVNGQTGAVTVTAPVTSVNGQTGAVTVAADDKTWNGVTLDLTGTSSSSGDATYYIPGRTSTSATTAYQITATSTPTKNKLALYDSSLYLHSTTPTASDSSTKVATTAFVAGEISGLSIPSKTSDLTNDSGFITSAPVTSVNGQTGAVTVTVPTKVSDLTNDSGFITSYTETDPTVPSWAKESSKPSYTASEVGAVADCTISLYNGNAGNPNPIKFLTVDYNSTTSEAGVLIKITMMSGHGNGASYNYYQDAIFSVSYQGAVSCNVYRYYAASITYDSTTHYYGDIFWVIDTTNKVVDFYVLMGQYSTMKVSPSKRMNSSTGGTITQQTSATKYSSGTKNYASIFWMDGSTKQNIITKTTVTLSASAWSNNTITVTVSGVTSSNTVIVSPAPASFEDYRTAVIYCSAQSTDSLTFTCLTTPTTDITVNVLII